MANEAHIGIGNSGTFVGIKQEVGNITKSIATSAKDFRADIRKKFLPQGTKAPNDNSGDFKGAQFAQNNVLPDWRVKLSIPDVWLTSLDDAIWAPLIETDQCFIFPYTPTMMIDYQVGYSPTKPIHSNYPFYAYQNSEPSKLQITSDFTVETEEEGKYWISAQHYLKSITKMAYGNNDTISTGAPPPIVKLNGYGNHMFKDVPVVIQNFNTDLANDVDYMLIKDFGGDSKGTYVPVKSTVSVGVQMVHSRQKIRTFSLEKFIQGDYVNTGEFR